MQYRRTTIAGGTYFFTVNLAERHRRLLVEHVDLLRTVVTDVKNRHPFVIDAFVVLPDHLHAVWTLPLGDADYATRWMLIKTGFSRKIVAGERRSESRRKKGERGLWQRRYWEHLIRDDQGLRAARGVYPLQSGEARPCDSCRGLAAFQYSLLHLGGNDPP